jgi:4'-phosphopantetheinyl transferase
VEELDSGQIHLWLAYLGEITDPRLLAEYRTLLSEEELQRQQRFHFQRDRHRYLVTHALVRTVLSRYAAVAPQEWTFDFNSYGRPSVGSAQTMIAQIEFNTSHTDGLVAVATTRERQIGVDAENLRTRQIDIGIADRYFAPAEVASLHALPREHRRRRFLEYWTLKESYIKARGMGLSIPLDQFSFDFSLRNGVRLQADARLLDSPLRWSFSQLVLDEEYVVATCHERLGSDPPRWTIRRAVPLLGEKALTPPFSRTSQ